jgi:hypothetical protein
VAEEGGFLYDADDYSDDCRSGTLGRQPQLIVPYTLEANDMRFSGHGLNTGEQFFSYLQGRLRRALRRGRGAAEDDERRAALPASLGGPGRWRGWRRFIRFALGHQDGLVLLGAGWSIGQALARETSAWPLR